MFFVFRDSSVIYMCVMDIMNVLRTGMNMSISHIHVWLCNNIKHRKLFTAKSILVENQYCYYLTISGGIKGFIPFPRVIVQKMNVSARLEFELAYDDVVLQY